jgi:hypothetical protein
MITPYFLHSTYENNNNKAWHRARANNRRTKHLPRRQSRSHRGVKKTIKYMNNDKFFQPVFTPNGRLTLDNSRSIEVEIASSGDGVRYRIVGATDTEPAEIHEADICEQGTEYNGFFIGSECYNLNDFIKIS